MRVGVSKIAVQLKLTPSPEQAAVLASTLRALNDHATRVAEVAHEHGVIRDYELRKHTYQQLREAGVGSQAAQPRSRRCATPTAPEGPT
jgi:hypothetical protein